MPVFEITFSEPFLIEMFRRHRRFKTFTRYATPVKAFLGLCLIGLIVVCLLAKTYLGAAVVFLFFALLVFAHRIDEWLVARRFRKSPYRNECIRIHLSTDGFTANGTKSNAQLSWAVFTDARRLDDGFLLFQGPDVFNWLPFSAITEGTKEEAEELIRIHVSNYNHA